MDLYNGRLVALQRTNLLGKTQLERVVDIANQKYNKTEYALTEKTPYVRKLSLKVIFDKNLKICYDEYVKETCIK